MKFKLFKNEHLDEQKEKHEAYTKKGFSLTVQKQDKNGTIRRLYSK